VDLRRANEGLAGYAGPVGALPADQFTLDHGDRTARPKQPVRRDLPAGSHAEHDDVEAVAHLALFFTYTLVLTKFYGVSSSYAPIYLIAFAVGNLAGPLTIGWLFDTIGRWQMIAATYILSGALLAATAYLFDQGVLTALTQTIAGCVIFFFASSGASAAYLTVSEIFPIEVRAQAIAVFFAIAQCFGAIGPIFYGHLIGDGADTSKLLVRYLIAPAAEWSSSSSGSPQSGSRWKPWPGRFPWSPGPRSPGRREPRHRSPRPGAGRRSGTPNDRAAKVRCDEPRHALLAHHPTAQPGQPRDRALRRHRGPGQAEAASWAVPPGHGRPAARALSHRGHGSL
jgi:hypothetical protein